MRGLRDKPLAAVQGSTTLIAKQATVTGDIQFSSNLDIEGRVVGAISVEPGK